MVVKCELVNTVVGMNMRRRVAVNFRRLRKAMGWSREEAALQGGVSPNYISQIEQGHGSFGQRALVKWASVFGVDISEFVKEPDGVPAEPSSHDKEIAGIIALYNDLKRYGLAEEGVLFWRFLIAERRGKHDTFFRIGEGGKK